MKKLFILLLALVGLTSNAQIISGNATSIKGYPVPTPTTGYLYYSGGVLTWAAGGGGGGGVTSFNSRTGAVTPQVADYSSFYLQNITGYLGVTPPLTQSGSGTLGVPYSLGITADAVPTSGSINMPTSGGVYNQFVSVSNALAGKSGLTTNNTLTGTNTFTGEVIVPTPVNSTDATTKTYVDNGLAAKFTSGFNPPTSSSIALGTSIMIGLINYGSGGYYTKPYIQQVADYCQVTINNLAISSTGARKAYFQLSNNLGLSPVPLFSDAFFNNVRVTSSSKAVRYAAASAGMRAAAALNWSTNLQFIYSGTTGTLNSNVTLSNSGNWAGASSTAILNDYGSRSIWYRANIASQIGANMAIDATVTANETMTIRNVSGYGIAIATWGTDGVTNNWSRIQYSVDGVTIGTYNPNGNAYLGFPDGGTTDGIMNDAIVITGLADTLHTVVLTFLDGGKPSKIDYVTGLISAKASTLYPFYVMAAYHMSNAASVGYNYPGYVTTQAVMDSATIAVISTLNTNFTGGYAIVNVNTNAGYFPNIGTTTQPDGIHPLQLGHTDIVPSITSQFPQYFTGGSSSSSGITGLTSNYIPLAYTSSTLANSILNQPTTRTINLTGATPSYVATDNTGSNAAYFNNYGDYAQFGANRDPGTGTFKNTGKYSSQIGLGATSSFGGIIFYTSNASNTNPTQAAYYDNLGNHVIGNSSSTSSGNGKVNIVGLSTTSDLVISTGLTASTGALYAKFATTGDMWHGDADWNGTNYIARGGTFANLIQYAGTTGMGFYCKTGLTNGSTFSFSGSDKILNLAAGVASIPITTASTSSTTGALTVAGGVGIAGATFHGGKTTFATPTTSLASFNLPAGTLPTSGQAAGDIARSSTDGNIYTYNATFGGYNPIYSQLKGSTTLTSGTVTVSNTNIQSTSMVIPVGVGATNGGNLGVTITAGTGFTIASTNPVDARTVNYIIIF